MNVLLRFKVEKNQYLFKNNFSPQVLVNKWTRTQPSSTPQWSTVRTLALFANCAVSTEDWTLPPTLLMEENCCLEVITTPSVKLLVDSALLLVSVIRLTFLSFFYLLYDWRCRSHVSSEPRQSSPADLNYQTGLKPDRGTSTEQKSIVVNSVNTAKIDWTELNWNESYIVVNTAKSILRAQLKLILLFIRP